MGASTPHFALQLRERIAKLIADLPADHPARWRARARSSASKRLGFAGEIRGETGAPGEHPLPSLDGEAIGRA